MALFLMALVLWLCYCGAPQYEALAEHKAKLKRAEDLKAQRALHSEKARRKREAAAERAAKAAAVAAEEAKRGAELLKWPVRSRPVPLCSPSVLSVV